MRLLGDACSMMLKPSANAQPFGPVLVIDNHRSPAIADFSERDLDFLELIAPDLPGPWIQASLADIVWSRRRKPEFALIAIDAYSKLPIDLDSWVSRLSPASPTTPWTWTCTTLTPHLLNSHLPQSCMTTQRTAN